jgi:peptidoglycan/LPS O-acetylase OafA/YrhL
MTSAPTQPALRSVLPRLSGLRAPLILVVLGAHSIDNQIGTRLWHVPVVWRGLFNAEWVLSVFFILSGFLLTLGWQEGQSSRRFYIRRFARIYPIYALAWLAAVVGQWLATGDVPSVPILLATLFLVQSLVPSTSYVFGVNVAFWSLSDEAIFYALLPFALKRLNRMSTRKLGLILGSCCAWIAIVPVVMFRFSEHTGMRLLVQMPWYRGAEFFCGVLVCLLAKRGVRPRRIGRTTVATLVGYIVAVSLLVDAVARHIGHKDADRAFGLVITFPAAFALVVVLIERDLRGMPGVLARPIVVRLGDWTYAMYLFHIPLLLVPAVLGWEHLGALPDAGLFIAYCVTTVALAGLAHERYLTPIERAIRGRWAPSRRAIPVSVPVQPLVVTPPSAALPMPTRQGVKS